MYAPNGILEKEMSDKDIFNHKAIIAIFNIINEMLIVLNHNNQIQTINPAVKAFFGCEFDENCPIAFTEWCQQLNIPSTFAETILQTRVEGNEDANLPFQHLNGTNYILNWQKIFQSDQATILTITQKKQSDAPLKSNDTLLLQQVISALPGSIFWKDLQGKYLGCNDVVTKIAGFSSAEQIIGKTDFQLRWKDRALSYLKHDAEVVKTGHPMVLEENFIRAEDGSNAVYLSTKKPLRNKENEIIGIICNSIDITDLKNLELQLAQAKRQTDVYLKNILDSLPGSIYWKDREGKYLGCNHFVVKMAKCNSVNEIIGKSDYDIFSDLIGKNTIKQVIEHDKMVIESGKTHTYEEYWISNDKPAIYLSTKRPLKDENGKIIGVLGNSIDITQRKKEEEARLESMRALGGSIAHEFRTPLGGMQASLTGIQRYLPRLIKAYNAAKEANLDIETIASKHLDSLTDIVQNGGMEIDYARNTIDMLLTNLNQGRIKQDDFSVCSVKKAINQAITRYPMTPAERQILEWHENDDFEFFGDEILLTHVLFNLLKNALYYIGRSKKADKKITIWIEHGEKYNTLHFKDNGLGVPTDDLSKLFNRFFTTSVNGTGLGLAFCKMVMEAFNGSIECQSQEGEYTEFILKFPK